MGKTNERLKQIVNYLQGKDSVKTSDLLNYLSAQRLAAGNTKPLKKSSLSEDIEKLKQQGYQFKRTRGVISLIDTEQEPIEQITVSALCCAEIIMVLFHKGFHGEMSISEIDSYLFDNDSLNENHSTLRALLKKMVNNGLLIERKAEKKLLYSLNNPTFYVRYFEPKKLPEIRDTIRTEGITQSYYSEFDSLCTVLDLLCSHDQTKEISDLIIHGKQNILSPQTRNNLYQLTKLPYSTKSLHFLQRTRKGNLTPHEYFIGTLIYSVEKNQVYLLGEDVSSPQKLSLPLDSITEIRPGDKPNIHFHSDEYQRIQNEMLSVSVDEPIHVSVRFENKKFVTDRVELLCNRRKTTAHIEQISSEEIRYEDTIRGLLDFARILRGFGPHAIVDEPEALRQKLIESAQKTLTLYKEASDE